jgi:hypothetical protein
MVFSSLVSSALHRAADEILHREPSSSHPNGLNVHLLELALRLTRAAALNPPVEKLSLRCIYKNKPIFYSLGNFIFENETLLRQPPEDYEPPGMTRDSGVGDFNDRRSNNDQTGFPADERVWQSMIAIPRFIGNRLTEVKLYPISLGFKQPRPDRGWPMLATPEVGKKIIDDVTNFSRPFGTPIRFQNGIGIVDVGTMKSDQ